MERVADNALAAASRFPELSAMPMLSPTPLSTGPRVWPRPKLIWRSSEVIQGRWWLGLFCSYERRPGYPGTGLAISVRGLLRWAVVLGVAGYFGGAAVVARWFARNPYNRIGYSDVLAWPVRRDHIAALRGQSWLAQGKDAVKAKRWAEGVFYLRRGLELCPEDFEARLVLAQFYLLSGQRTVAIALLTDGAWHGLPSVAWRDQYFTLTAAGEDWASALRFCDRCLSLLPGTVEVTERQVLLAHKLAALIALDRAAEALGLAEAEGAAAMTPVKTQRARALLALGRAGEAAEFLAQWRAALPDFQRPPVIRLQVQALREAGRLDEMERALADLRALNPARAEPLAYAVEQRARAGVDASAALGEYLFRFGATSANLVLLAQPLAEIPDVALLQRVVAAAVERGYPPRPFRVQLATALLRQGDWPALARQVAELAPAFASASTEGRLYFEWIQCLSEALSTSAPGVPDRVVAFLQTRMISLQAHRLTAAALRRAGREEAARATLAVSLKLYAESPWLHMQLAEVERALAAAPVVAATATPATPEPAVTANWRDYFRGLDETIAAQNWTEANRLIATVRRARPAPAWLAARDADLLSREVRVVQGLHDAPGLRRTLNLYLNGSAERSSELLSFARELHAAGAADDALTIVKAVMEKSPDHPEATSLFSEWRPRRRP